MPFPIRTGVESGRISLVFASVATHSVLVKMGQPKHTQDFFKSATVGTEFPMNVYDGEIEEQSGQERHTLPTQMLLCPLVSPARHNTVASASNTVVGFIIANSVNIVQCNDYNA